MSSTAAVATRRLDSLTGVRAIAALLVFGYHAINYMPDGELSVFGAGMAGVSLFYILSGFVMAWIHRADDTPARFYRRRIARIYPAYAVAVVVALTVAVATDDFAVTDLAAFTLLQAWVPDPSIYYAASPVFWSLSCEAFFYLVFPLVADRIARMRTASLWALVGIAAAAVIGIGILASPFIDNGFVRWAVYIFPVTRSLEFFVGVGLGFLFARGFRLKGISPYVVAAVALLATAAAAYAPHGMRIAAITLIPFGLLVIALGTGDTAGRATVFGSRWMVALGVWSYCFYLLHGMIQGWSIKAVGFIDGPDWVGLLLSLPAAIIAAWLLHVLVEKPGERRLRPKGSGRRIDSD